MVEQSAGRKTMASLEPKDERSKSVQSTLQEAKTGTLQEACGPAVPSRLEKAISELEGLKELLLSGNLDPRILTGFRDALNRVRTAAWAAQQYVARKELEGDSTSVLAFLAGDRVRAAYHLCRAISEDLKRPDIAVPAGSLIQLLEVMSTLTEQLKGVVNKLG